MSAQYDEDLKQHKANVMKGFKWLQENLPTLKIGDGTQVRWQSIADHDASKYKDDEYEAYDKYFYRGLKTRVVIDAFNRAWLLHIHRNPHHWQHWVLINDDPGEGEIVLDMPYEYIIEMICDWWAFSWAQGNLHEIFNWYDKHKSYIKLSDNTRKAVEGILSMIKEKLEQED